MELKLATSCVLPKRMSTERPGKAGESDDLVICTLRVSGVYVHREVADQLAGWPIGCSNNLYDELGAPHQHATITLPKRGLLFGGRIEHRKESGAATAAFEVKKAVVTAMKFALDVPDDKGPQMVFSFTLTWKTRGDEADDLKHLLRDRCFMKGTFQDEPQRSLLNSDGPSPKAEAEAGHRAKLDQKRRAAGEKDTDDDGADEDGAMLEQAIALITTAAVSPRISALQRELKIGYNRAARLIDAMEKRGIIGALTPEGTREVIKPKAATPPASPATKDGKVVDLSIERLTRDAKAVAAKHPRKTPPKPPTTPPRGRR